MEKPFIPAHLRNRRPNAEVLANKADERLARAGKPGAKARKRKNRKRKAARDAEIRTNLPNIASGA